MGVEVVFETHSTTIDNEAGIASGWTDTPLSEVGRRQARELGERRAEVAAVFCSDLGRAIETAEVAFGGAGRIHIDSRLRECDYGELTREPSERIDKEWARRVDDSFPGGESLRDVTVRVRSFLDVVARDWEGHRVLLIGHRATKLALDNLLADKPLEAVASEPFVWQPGWTYLLEAGS